MISRALVHRLIKTKHHLLHTKKVADDEWHMVLAFTAHFRSNLLNQPESALNIPPIVHIAHSQPAHVTWSQIENNGWERFFVVARLMRIAMFLPLWHVLQHLKKKPPQLKMENHKFILYIFFKTVRCNYVHAMNTTTNFLSFSICSHFLDPDNNTTLYNNGIVCTMVTIPPSPQTHTHTAHTAHSTHSTCAPTPTET